MVGVRSPKKRRSTTKKLESMPGPQGNKRVKGVQIYRPFVFGSIARKFEDNKRPPNIDPQHTHQWTIWVKGVDDEDISYWLRKVQFKLHDTYPNSLRTLEGPPFEITETGWGEFEIQIKLHFVPEANEKFQCIWHPLKLHPYGPDAEALKDQPIISQNYEEVVFNEPVEAFYEILTGGVEKGKAKAGKAGSKQAALAKARTAEIPMTATQANPYSKETEQKEHDRLQEAIKKVDELVGEETEALRKTEAQLLELRERLGQAPKKK